MAEKTPSYVIPFDADYSAFYRELQNALKVVDKTFGKFSNNFKIPKGDFDIIASEISRVNAKFTVTKDKVDEINTKLRDTKQKTDKVKSSTEILSGAWNKLSSVGSQLFFTINGIQSAFSTIRSVFSSATESFIAFEKSLREVQSIANVSTGQLQQYANTITQISTETGFAAEDIGRSLYQIISAGVPTAGALNVVSAASKAAVAGLTNSATAASGLTAVLNSYSLEAESVGHVSDVLFKTVFKGVTTFEQLASGIGEVTPLAASLGISLEDVAGAFAAITQKGISPAQAFTQLKRAIISIGQAYGDTVFAGRDLLSVFEQVAKEAGYSSTALLDILGRQEAVQAIIATTGEQLEKSQGIFTEIADNVGATQTAFDENIQSLDKTIEKVKRNIEALKRSFLQELLPAIEIVSNAIIKLSKSDEAIALLIGSLVSFASIISTVVIFQLIKFIKVLNDTVVAFNILGLTINSSALVLSSAFVVIAGILSFLGLELYRFNESLKVSKDGFVKVEKSTNDAKDALKEYGKVLTQVQQIENLKKELEGLDKQISELPNAVTKIKGKEDAIFSFQIVPELQPLKEGEYRIVPEEDIKFEADIKQYEKLLKDRQKIEEQLLELTTKQTTDNTKQQLELKIEAIETFGKKDAKYYALKLELLEKEKIEEQDALKETLKVGTKEYQDTFDLIEKLYDNKRLAVLDVLAKQLKEEKDIIDKGIQETKEKEFKAAENKLRLLKVSGQKENQTRQEFIQEVLNDYDKLIVKSDELFGEDSNKFTELTEEKLTYLKEVNNAIVNENERVARTIATNLTSVFSLLADNTANFAEKMRSVMIFALQAIFESVINAKIGELTAVKIGEIGKAGIEAPLSFGATLAAIAPITAAYIAAISLLKSIKFAKGGFTGNGTIRDETGQKVAGIVHEREFVFNRNATQGNITELYGLQKLLASGKKLKDILLPNIQLTPTTLGMDKLKFADGGFTGQAILIDSTINNQLTELNSNIVKLRNDVKTSNVQSDIYINANITDDLVYKKYNRRDTTIKTVLGTV